MNPSFLLVCCALLCDYVLGQGRGIPGSTHTLSGYDTEKGVDPVCWSSIGADKYVGSAYPFPNPLVADFSVAGNITLMPECPVGNSITAFAPVDRETVPGKNNFNRSRLETGTWYNFPVHATFNLTSLDSKYFVSDLGPTVAFQVVLCINGVSGFCSPYVSTFDYLSWLRYLFVARVALNHISHTRVLKQIHEEANERIVRSGGVIAPVATGDQHGGTHVHSPYVFRNLTFEDGPIYEVDVEVPILVNDEADFYAIAAVQFFLGDDLGDIPRRIDMSNALVEGQRLLAYFGPPKILDVPTGVLWFCNLLRFLSATIIIFLLGQTIYYRNHQVLKLSQQPFLVVFLTAALAAIVGSIMLEPKNDLYCRWSKFVVLSSLHLLLAVTAGRMWRINAVISPLLVQTMRKREARYKGLFCRAFQKENTPRINIRKEFRPWHLTAAIAIFTIPVVLILLAAAIWQEETLTINYNFEKSVGRLQCSVDLPRRHRLSFYGECLFVCLVLLLLGMAHMTQHLPSLFNETEVIFNTGLTSLVVLGVGFAVINVTDDPETSPGVSYLTWSVLVFFITVSTSCRIMLPKLQMVWRGETVLVSKLVSDHARAVREDDESFLSDGNGKNRRVRVTGIGTKTASFTDSKGTEPRRQDSDSFQSYEKETRFPSTDQHYKQDTLDIPKVSSLDQADELERQSSLPQDVNDSSSGQDETKPLQSQEDAASSNTRRVVFKINPPFSSNSKASRKFTVKGADPSLPSAIQPLIVSQSETPSNHLVLKMYHLQAHLAEVNQRILSGAAVSKTDWETLRHLSTQMGDTFHAVTFDWAPEGYTGPQNEENCERPPV